MIRALRPTDVLAYLAFRESASTNEALIGADGGRSAPTIRAFLGSSLEPRRQAWVQIDRGRIAGLVAIRARFGADIWDIDQLIAASSVDEDRTYFRLLEHLCQSAVDEGVARVFLRLATDSPCVAAARQSGFCQYATERIYQLPAEARPRPVGAMLHLRPRRPSDHVALFQLYHAVVPFRVRQVEGMTLQEWRWTDAWGMPPGSLRLRLAGHRRDYILPTGSGSIAAWLRLDPSHGLVRLLWDSRAEVDVGSLVEYALGQLPPRLPVTCPVRDHQAELGTILDAQGFTGVAGHTLLARALVQRLPETKLVPVHVS